MSDTPECPAGDECASPFCAVHAERNAARAPAPAPSLGVRLRDLGPESWPRTIEREVADLERGIAALGDQLNQIAAWKGEVLNALADLRDRLAKLEAANAETEPPDVDANVTM